MGSGGGRSRRPHRGGHGLAGARRSTPAWRGPAAPPSTAAAGLDPELERPVAGAGGRLRGSRPGDVRAWRGTWSVPAVVVHGSEDLKRRFLGPIYRGDLLCSQLLSEPEAGSDLAGLKTRAVQGRRRVDRQRPEGLELLRPQGPDRPADGAHRPRRPQAPGPDDVPAAAGHARRRGAAAQADDGRRRVQRGLPDRRPRARRQPGRRARQRLARRADDADVGAGLGRVRRGATRPSARCAC